MTLEDSIRTYIFSLHLGAAAFCLAMGNGIGTWYSAFGGIVVLVSVYLIMSGAAIEARRRHDDKKA
jgi:uncharacterized membrane protein YhaH (DUF805 family)